MVKGEYETNNKQDKYIIYIPTYVHIFAICATYIIQSVSQSFKPRKIILTKILYKTLNTHIYNIKPLRFSYTYVLVIKYVCVYVFWVFACFNLFINIPSIHVVVVSVLIINISSHKLKLLIRQIDERYSI